MTTMLWHRHKWRNRLQTLLVILSLFGIAALAGYLLLGDTGLAISLVASAIALLIEPVAGHRLTLRLYRARPILFQEAPQLWRILNIMAGRAGLSSLPILYLTPSLVINAFAVGNKNNPVIALSEGMLRSMSLREIAAVLGHEVAHIAQGDLYVLNLADYISRLTALLALSGQFLILLYLPWLLEGSASINWMGLLILAISPHLAFAAQLRLSRVREFDADLEGARLCGDPLGLASALAKIERISNSWHRWIMPGWGNPDPSWLRTHPPTDERIRRLSGLVFSQGDGLTHDNDWHWPSRKRQPPVLPLEPRWHIGSYWW